MSDIYAEMHSYRIACCEANAKADKLQAENVKLKEQIVSLNDHIACLQVEKDKPF